MKDINIRDFFIYNEFFIKFKRNECENLEKLKKSDLFFGVHLQKSFEEEKIRRMKILERDKRTLFLK
jgi:hypothetical protein